MPRRRPKPRGRTGGPPKRDPTKYNDYLERKRKAEQAQKSTKPGQRQKAQRQGRRRRTSTARRNQTLSNIAKDNNVSVQDLLAANPQVREVKPGMVLNIPGQRKPDTDIRSGFESISSPQLNQAVQRAGQGGPADPRRGRGYRRAQEPAEQVTVPGRVPGRSSRPVPPGQMRRPVAPEGAARLGPAAGRVGGRPPVGGGPRTRGRFRTPVGQTPPNAYDSMVRRVQAAGGDVKNIGFTYGPFVPYGPAGPGGEPPAAPFVTYNEEVAQGEGTLGTYVLEDVFDEGYLPISMTTNQANTLGLDPELMAEFYYIDEWGNWVRRNDIQDEEPAAAYGGLQGGYRGYGGGGWGRGSGGGRGLQASPDWLQDSPYTNGLTSWSIR